MQHGPCELTVGEAAEKIARRELASENLVRSCLARIEEHDDAVKAWVLVDREGALAAAQQRDIELAKGEHRGPWHGIPVGVKDIYHTAGLPTGAGSPVWREPVSDEDAAAVASLRRQGAVVLGKTHTTPFAHLDPPPTRNPWNLGHTPGGSSSGSAAAVAARMCPVAFGSQTGGSTIRPAAFTGVVGFKPQYGRISTFGIVPLARSIDTVGLLTRSVADAAMMMDALVGHDPRTASSTDRWAQGFHAALERSDHPPRLGVVRSHQFGSIDAEVADDLETVINRLRDGGVHLEDVVLPASFDRAYEDFGTISDSEVAAFHEELFEANRPAYGPMLTGAIENGLRMPAVRYVRALRARGQLQNEAAPILAGWDALVAPAMGEPAPPGDDPGGYSEVYSVWTHLGVPTLSLPTGLAGSGLPLAVQLVGPTSGEGRLLRAAHWCEKVLGVRLRPPLD